MYDFSLQRLTCYAFRNGTHSYNYAAVKGNKDDASANKERAAAADDRADRFTDWPPQPMTEWFEA
jgi:hypothetical protein